MVDDYLSRLTRMAPQLGFRDIRESEVAEGGGLDAEGERLLAKLTPGAKAFRLDEHGKSVASTAFAANIADWRDGGQSEAVFIIGGAEGFSAAVRQAVPATMAFGNQTWPHRLVRVMVAEQLYRAATILAGTPYHKA